MEQGSNGKEKKKTRTTDLLVILVLLLLQGTPSIQADPKRNGIAKVTQLS